MIRIKFATDGLNFKSPSSALSHTRFNPLFFFEVVAVL
jgi:hypothetical protein